MEAAEIADDLITGALPQVVGIAAEHLDAQLLDVRGVAGADNGEAGTRHEQGRAHGGMGQAQFAQAGAGCIVFGEKGELHRGLRGGDQMMSMQSP